MRKRGHGPRSSRRIFLKRMLGLAAATTPLARHAQAEGFCHRDVLSNRACQAGLRSHLVEQSAAAQEASEWCWAACISMVFDYFGRPVSQARIVQETFGAPLNLPARPADILAQINRPWEDDGGLRFFAEGGLLPVQPRAIATSLAQDKPLIVGSLGHAMVLIEYRWWEDAFGQHRPRAAVVRDPAQGGRERILTREELRRADLLAFVNVVG